MSSLKEGGLDEVKDLFQLRELIKGSELLDPFHDFLTDTFLLSFIRGKKHNIQNAFSVLEGYFRTRCINERKLFLEMSPRGNKFLEEGVLQILAKSDHHGRPVLVDRTRLWNPRGERDVEEALSMFILAAEELLESEAGQKNGIIFILDASEFGFDKMRHLGPRVMFRALSILHKNMPIRVQGLHSVKENRWITGLFNAVRPFLPPKLKKRIFFHGSNLEGLHDHVPRSILPTSLGGSVPDEEAYDVDFETRILAKEDYYSRLSLKLGVVDYSSD